MAAVGLCYCMGTFSGGEPGLLLVVCGLLIAVASLALGELAVGKWASVVVAHRLRSCSSWAPEHRLSSSGSQV